MEVEAPVREKSPMERADKSFAQHEESVIDEAFGFIDEWSETLSNAEVRELNVTNGDNNAALASEVTSAKIRRVSVVEQEQCKSRKTWEKRKVQRSVSVFQTEHPKIADSGSKSQSCKVLSHARSLPGINKIQEDAVQNNGKSEKEVKRMKEWLQFEKELAVRSALQDQESQWQKQRQSNLTKLSLETERLQARVRRLSEEKTLLESTLLKKNLEEKTLKRNVQLIKRDAERYVNRLAQNAHRQEVREQHEIRKLEQSVKAKEEIIKEKEQIIAKLEAEKLYLGEEIYRLTGVEEAFWSDETLQAPAVTARERGLLRRASELSLHATKLEKKCAILSGENEVLKRKMELEQEKERPLREREKDKDRERERERQRELGTLKKKNQELALQTRKLEEKVKSLEKKSKESPVLNSLKTVEQPQQQRRVVQTYPQSFKWREKEAELQQLQKQLNERDREIGRLKEKLRELTKSLKQHGSSTKLGNEVATLEVESVLKLVSKEKLQLERHLMLASQGVQRHAELEAGRYAELEATNQQLRQQLEQLECLCREQSEAAAQLSRRQADREQQLAERLHQQQQLCNDLESQLSRVIDKNAEVTIENSDLKKQILELKQAESECATLRASLTAAQSECTAAQAEVSSLREKMAGLENVLRQMREAADKKRELERQHAEALAQLRDQQAQLALLSKASESEKAQAAVLIENLQSKVREFDRKAELQNVRHDELMLEMAALKKSQAQSLSQSSLNHSGPSSLDNGYAPGSGLNKSRYAGIDLDSRTSSPDSLRFVSNGNVSRTTPLPGATPSDPLFDDLRTAHKGESRSTGEIDRIMAKIEQDNRVLAELDKSRATICNTTTSTALGVDSGYLSQSSASQSLSPILTSTSGIATTHPLPQVTLAHAIPTSQLATAAFNPLNLNLVNTVNPILPQLNSVPGLNTVNSLTNHANSLAYSTFTMVGPTVTNPPLALPNIPVEVNGPSYYHTNETESKADMLDIPGKGRCYVYIARYSYDPFSQSPNENPEAELLLHAGDYVLIWGTMDEDGFYDGELLDGRRGLVPSNLVQRLVGEDLLEFHRAAVLGLQLADDSVSTALPREVLTLGQPTVNPEEINGHDEAARRAMDMGLMDLQDFLEDEEIALGVRGEGPVPPPKQLTLERQLNKSIVIGWNPPDASQGTIDCYHVYVDGVLKTTVRASERTRALIEGVDSGKVHRISVRSVTPRRRASLDAACTMVIGKDAPLAPTCVKASHITTTSAIISWLPSNSNFQHTVCVNSVEVRTLKPGVFRHTISGLSPNTVYRVSVRAKNIRSPHYDAAAAAQLLNDQEKYATHVEFRTLPKGVPDPPVDVQVEAGPQDGTLLVTWLPVTISSTAGTSNGVPVTGYAVYADGKKVTDVDTPTGDHALLDIGSLLGLEAKALTVRTKARDTQSADSIPAPIPSNVIRNTKRGPPTKNAVSESVSESITLDLVKQIQENLTRESLWTYSYPLLKEPNDSDERPSELSDIAEEPEDISLSDQESLDTINERERRRPPPDHGYPARPYNDEEDYRGNYREYPPNQVIPSIEITKDSASERSVERYPPMDYERRGAPRGRVREPPSVRDRSLPPNHRGDRQRYGNDPYYDRENRGRAGPGPSQGPLRRPPPNRSDTRIFVALFDYDPPTMSPNPDACEEELPFREGQLIKIRGDKDTDGFYWGEAGGKCGYVPCNMVSEVQVDDERVAEELLKESGENGPPAHHGYSHPRGKGGRRGLPPRGAHSRDRWGDIYANMPVKKMLALYDYDPQELSPNVDSEVELSFQTGDVIYVYGDMDDDGFYMGELRGVRGLVPSNFLTEAPPDNDSSRRNRGLDDRDRSMGRERERDRERLSGADGPPPPPRGNLRMERRKDNRNSPVDRRLPYDHERLGPRDEDQLTPMRRDGSRPRLHADESFSDLEDRRSNHNPNVEKPNANGPVPVTNNNGSPGQNTLKRGPMKGLPSVFPDLSLIGQNNTSGTGPNMQSAANAKTGPAPNSSAIASASAAITNPVEGLFTKGKDLIFKKFGLGE